MLLRSSGELSAAASTALASALAADSEAADYARFIERELPKAALAPRDFAEQAIALASVAPRDFAEQAIALVLPHKRRRVIRPLWAFAAAAAVMISFIMLRPAPEPITVVSMEEPSPRITVVLSARLDTFEDELSAARHSHPRTRYGRLHSRL